MSTNKDRLYKCEFCNDKFTKADLVNHVIDKHEDMIPKKYTAFRTVYDYLNINTNKKCCICNKDANWNEDKGKYDKTCKNKACIKKYMNINFNTPEGQADLLSKRKISGIYKMSDGFEKTYTGSYEKKCLEFMDKILKVSSEDIMAPGVSLEYEYDGSKHIYLSDFYYIPYNLIIEVKDGGDNPNRKEMVEYRNKTIAKEKYIMNNTMYNYIRLTDNDFSQLLTIFFELKMKYLDNDITNRIIKINE